MALDAMERLIGQLQANLHRGRARPPSGKWVSWVSIWSPTRCLSCKELHGTIYSKDDFGRPEPPIHEYCRCMLVMLPAIQAGTATIDGFEGVDYYIVKYGALPDNYISGEMAKQLGWISKQGNLSDVAPGKQIGGGIYSNRDEKLPSAFGRV